MAEIVKKSIAPRPRRKVLPPKKVLTITANKTVRAPTRAVPVKSPAPASPQAYFSAVGRRKEAVARVRLYLNAEEGVIINEKPLLRYFPYFEHQQIVSAPLKAVGRDGRVLVTAQVFGGGTRGQAEAVRLGIARALVQSDPQFKKSLRAGGFLTRDPRAKERKKYGLKRARRAPQFAKR